MEALYKMMSLDWGHGFSVHGECMTKMMMVILSHPNNHSITAENLIQYLQEKDDHGIMRLHHLKRSAMLEVLKLVKDKKLSIDLHTPHPITNKPLLSQWLQRDDVTNALLDVDPTIVKDSSHEELSFFGKAVASYGAHHRDIARRLWKTMMQQKVEPSKLDKVLFQVVFNPEHEKRLEAFQTLSPHIQKLFGNTLVFSGDIDGHGITCIYQFTSQNAISA
jgi:hypothetical protein